MDTRSPKLRFPEFEGNWEKKTFKDLVKINQGLQIQISERFLTEVENSHFYITNEFLKEGSDKKFYIKNPTESVLCDSDDILMTRTGNTGMVVTNVKGAFHNNFFKIKYPITVDKNFLYYFLNTVNTQNTIKNLAGTSTIPDLNHTDFYKINFIHPSIEEQIKISSFVSTVDDKLRLLKEKKSLIEEYKTGLMRKIFNQKIRFKDDDGKDFADWEEMTLGNIGKTFNGLTGKSKEDFGSGKPYIQYKQIFDNSKININGCQLVDINEKDNQNKVQYGDVFFTVSSETQNEIGTASVLLDNVEEMYLNSFCFGYRANSLERLVPEFSRYLFRNELFRNDIIKLAQGSTRYNMSKVSLMKLKVVLPQQKEQIKIANFLSVIDGKLELIKRQILDNQQYKIGLLQQMFI